MDTQHQNANGAADDATGAATAAAGTGGPVSKFAKNNTEEKKQDLAAWHARVHGKTTDVLVKKCHRQWKRGDFAEVKDLPGDRVGIVTSAATPVTVWNVNAGSWANGVFHRRVLSRSADPDMAVVVVGDGIVVAPLQLVRKRLNE